MTWFGHCITNVSSALKALPTAGQLMLISDLRGFLDRQEEEIRRREREVQFKADEHWAVAKGDPTSTERYIDAINTKPSFDNGSAIGPHPTIADTPQLPSRGRDQQMVPAATILAGHHDRTPRSHRLLSRNQTKQKAAQLVAVGDLSTWEVHPSWAITGLFSDHGRGD
jgi:hypothetical protein